MELKRQAEAESLISIYNAVDLSSGRIPFTRKRCYETYKYSNPGVCDRVPDRIYECERTFTTFEKPPTVYDSEPTDYSSEISFQTINFNPTSFSGEIKAIRVE